MSQRRKKDICKLSWHKQSSSSAYTRTSQNFLDFPAFGADFHALMAKVETSQSNEQSNMQSEGFFTFGRVVNTIILHCRPENGNFRLAQWLKTNSRYRKISRERSRSVGSLFFLKTGPEIVLYPSLFSWKKKKIEFTVFYFRG